jgi:hypothetical protein
LPTHPGDAPAAKCGRLSQQARHRPQAAQRHPHLVYRLGVVPCADWRKLFACARQLLA